MTTTEGTPQGWPLSPLRSNSVLEERDWEIERRGLSFVRDADDAHIYVVRHLQQLGVRKRAASSVVYSHRSTWALKPHVVVNNAMRNVHYR